MRLIIGTEIINSDSQNHLKLITFVHGRSSIFYSKLYFPNLKRIEIICISCYKVKIKISQYKKKNMKVKNDISISIFNYI